MKIGIAIIILIAVVIGGYQVWEYWDRVDKERDIQQQEKEKARNITPQSLSGLPYMLEEPLRKAQQEGPVAFKNFIERIRMSPLVKDPRLAWIELDYVVMLSGQDPVEAKRVFGQVKKRVPEDSPIHERIKALEKTYE